VGDDPHSFAGLRGHGDSSYRPNVGPLSSAGRLEISIDCPYFFFFFLLSDSFLPWLHRRAKSSKTFFFRAGETHTPTGDGAVIRTQIARKSNVV